MADENQLRRETTLDNFASEKINVVANGLLGTYDKKGNYTISQPLKDELIKLTKYKKRNFNNSIFCVSFKPDFGEYSFKIDYEKNTKDNVAKATLYLIETVYKVNGYIQDTINTKIGEYTSVLDDKFIENSYVALNVSNKWIDDGEGEGKEYIADNEKPHSMVYLQAYERFLETLDDLTKSKFNKLCEEFFEAKLTAMRSLKSPFAKEVLDSFSAEYAKIEKTFIVEKDFKSLNELFDVCVERAKLSKEPVSPEEIAKQSQEQEYFDKIKDAKAEFEQGVNKLYQKSIEKTVNRLPVEQKEKVQDALKPKAPEPVKEEPKPTKQTPTPNAPAKNEAPAKEEKPKQASQEANKNKLNDIMSYFNGKGVTSKVEKPKDVEEKINAIPVIEDKPKVSTKDEKIKDEKPKEKQNIIPKQPTDDDMINEFGNKVANEASGVNNEVSNELEKI